MNPKSKIRSSQKKPMCYCFLRLFFVQIVESSCFFYQNFSLSLVQMKEIFSFLFVLCYFGNYFVEMENQLTNITWALNMNDENTWKLCCHKIFSRSSYGRFLVINKRRRANELILTNWEVVEAHFILGNAFFFRRFVSF